MGTNRLKIQDEERAGTARLKSQTGKLKPATGKLKPEAKKPLATGTGRTPTGPLKPKYTTAQLRLPPSKRRRRGGAFRALLALTLVGGAGLTAAVGGAYVFLDSLGGHGKGLSLPAMAQGLMPIAERQNILLLGADYSYAEGHRMAGGPVRSDTIVVAGVDPQSNQVHMVSIPRDTRVYVHGHYDKINSALAIGGPKLASQVVSDLLGVPIHRWAQVNTRGLERLVDVIGGVEVYVEKDLNYVDHTAGLSIHIPHGEQRLGGQRAHQFVRFRHDELGDIGRVRRQQQFMRAAASQLMRPETVLKMPEILSTVKANIATNMTGAELMKLATWGIRLGRDNVKMVMLPGRFSAGQFATSYWLVDTKESLAIGARFLAEKPEHKAAMRERMRITVLNGTLRSGLASRAADKLRLAGWNVCAVGDAPQHHVATTRLIAQTGEETYLAPLGETLGVKPETITASIGDVNSDYTVVVGEDFAAR